MALTAPQLATLKAYIASVPAWAATEINFQAGVPVALASE